MVSPGSFTRIKIHSDIHFAGDKTGFGIGSKQTPAEQLAILRATMIRQGVSIKSPSMAGTDAEFRKQAHYVTENSVQMKNKNK
jgi:hypothetical protein